MSVIEARLINQLRTEHLQPVVSATKDRTKAIAFIDSGVADCQMLIAGVVPGIETVQLDASKDGVVQITKVLARYQNISAVHIISHGSPGCLKLGNSTLSMETADSYTTYLKQWRQVLNDSSAILLYGCHVAAGDAGFQLIQKLHRVTGAAIAASRQAVGNNALGGNWNLEVTRGELRVPLALRSEVMAAYPATFLDLADLDGSNGFVINGVGSGDQSGRSVSGAGDINGDGFNDLIIGARYADPNGNDSGESYVVFGSGSPAASLDLSTLNGTNGFRIAGLSLNDRSGFSVSGAGDVNNDTFDDVIIGARLADPNGNNSGQSYVIFGSNTPFGATFDLSTLDGTNGFTINGFEETDNLGFSVSSAGNINGDGFDDIIIGAYFANPNGNDSGQSYVIFGSGSPAATLNVSTLDGTNGFALNGISADDRSGVSVSSAGDVNMDGRDDIIIGADGPSSSSGQSYVIFGSNAPFGTSLELSALNGTNGFTINGIDASDQAGRPVSNAGDINDDGFDDLIIGARFADPNGNNSGESYVVFGSATPAASLNLSTLDGTNGFTLNGIGVGDQSGRSISNAGDINNDGIDDLVIGAFGSNPNGNNSGETYVVFGSDDPFAPSIELGSINGINGFTINGINAGDSSGFSVSGAGDVNNDGFDDLIIGSHDPNNGGAGQSYVVFGNIPEIDVLGSNMSITDGDITPTTADHTDFGSQGIDSGMVTRTFTIENTGTGDLTLGANAVTISGVDAADFTVTAQPAMTVAPSGSTTFMVSFDPSAVGIKNATLNINNNDSNESPYNFDIRGMGTVTPEIDVQGNGMSITDGDITPTITDHTDFGSQGITSGMVSRTFTIENTGSGVLTLGANAVSISGVDAADFTVTTQPAMTVAPSGSTTFIVSFDPSAIGVRNAMLNINNDDSDESPYNFNIQGNGTPGGTPGVTITETGGSTDVTEGGATDTYMVVLDAQPMGNVTVNITPDAQTNVSSTSLLFTDTNWDTPQAVTVTADDDLIAEGNHTSTISHEIAPGSSAEYVGLSINNVVANITDNDFNDIPSGVGGQMVTGTSAPDRFIYNNLFEGGDMIANFTTGDDKIDLSGVMSQIGYSGSNPIADSYLSFEAFGSGTMIKIDVDGTNFLGAPRNFLLVQDITPGALNDINNFII